MAWVLKAEGSTAGMVADATEVRRALSLFADPEGWCQVVALPKAHASARAGRDLDGLCEAVSRLPGGAGIYFEINTVRDGLETKAKASDIPRRRWLFIDIDPVKADGFDKGSATDEEKADALTGADKVYEYLTAQGWPPPVVTDSGNGWNLFYRIETPNDEESRTLVRSLLYHLATVVKDDPCKFDKSVHNADRLAKLPGTWARKGLDTADRPHRPTRIVCLPKVEVVPTELIRATIPETGKENGKPREPIPWLCRVTATGAGPRDYCLAALEGERVKLALTRPGDRDNQLYRSGAALGELIGADRLTDAEVWQALTKSADECGLREHIGEEQVQDKLRRSIEKGKGNPRVRPESNGFHKTKEIWKPLAATPTDGPVIYTLPDLLGLDIPAARWAIPGLLSEGLTILAGKPKLGKSWMALNLAMTIAAGGMALGSIRVQPGNVLYLALEDRLRRIRDRSRKVMAGLGTTASDRLSFAVAWPRQHEGGVVELAKWLHESDEPRLVVIDVWAKFRTPAKSKGSAYEQDYDQLTEVKSLGDHYGASVLALHHTRKSAAEDVFDEISGTLGIAGAADGSLVLARVRGQNEGTLAMTGRDIEEQTLAVEFDPVAFVWKSLGNAEELVDGKLQKKILAWLGERRGILVRTADIAAGIGENPDNLRKPLSRLFDRGLVHKVVSGNTSSWSVPGAGASGT